MLQLQSGLLIAIEGIDGSGKTTLAKTLHASLQEQGLDTVLTKEPGDSELGKEIRSLVCTQNVPICAKAQYLLFAADRAQHFTELIIPALRKKNIIICDRLSDSSLAYQSYGNGVEVDMIRHINAWSMEHLVPDLTIFVRIPVEIALERCGTRGSLSVYEKKDFLQRVAHGFEEIYKDRENLIIVDGTHNKENIALQTSRMVIEWIQCKNLLV
jgi:dTMP kinase